MSGERRLESAWQTPVAGLAFAVLLCTLVLGYGGDNFVFSSEMPVPVLWLLLSALIVGTGFQGARLVWRQHRVLFVVWAISFVGGLGRLAFDVKPYGLWALRSSIFFVASIAIFAGIYLGSNLRRRQWIPLVTIPMALVVIYMLTFPWREELWSISPVSGVFVPVPLLGHYECVTVAAAAVWTAFFARSDFRFPALALPAAALVGVGMNQVRLGYVAVFLGAGLSLFLLAGRERIPLLTLRGGVAAWLVALFLVVAALFPVAGRYGAFDPQFLVAHLNTILGHQGPALGSVMQRYTEYPVAVKELFAEPVGSLLLGKGLGAPIDLGVTGIYRKTLHLDYVEVVYRVGLAGVFWIGLTVGIALTVLRWTRTAIDRSWMTADERHAVLMICGLLLMSLIESMFEPHFFWAYGSVPFFFYAGLGLGVLDRMRSEAGAAEPVAVDA